MKKSVLIALLAVTLGSLNAQVKSVKLDSIISIVGGGKVYHTEATTGANDTFYTRVEVSQSSTFSGTNFYTLWKRRIGSGQNMDIIGYPLVDTLMLSYVRIQCAQDTNNILFKSNNLSVTPKHQVLKPTIYSISVNITTSGMTEKVGYTNGYADSSVIICEIALDSNYLTQTNKQRWSVKADGNLTYTVTGLKDNKQFFTRWTIINSAGSQIIKSSFWTIANAAKIWMRKPADTVKVTSSTCDIKGRAISYGLIGTIWVTIGGATVSNIASLTGIGEEWYILNVTGLTQNKSYIIWVHGKNAKGEDSFALSITTMKYFNPTFFVSTDMIVGVSDGTAEAYASYNVPKGQTATVTVGLFAEWDSLCENTLQDSTYVLGEGSGQLYKRFSGLAPGVYWIWFWGTCSDGQYELTPSPLKLSIWNVGIKSIETQMISVYPNPCTDFIHTTSFGPYSIHNVAGQIVATGTGSDINVSNLKPGTYIIKTESGFARFQKD